mmetsp:Transcript_7834/g.17002  ORF Transcript_7834/g.17002 Transcript_7834/m.17002 type:complete len:116 (+) Transcript_7834:341-688(+)
MSKMIERKIIPKPPTTTVMVFSAHFTPLLPEEKELHAAFHCQPIIHTCCVPFAFRFSKKKLSSSHEISIHPQTIYETPPASSPATFPSHLQYSRRTKQNSSFRQPRAVLCIPYCV